MACRLARFFNTTASFWIALQMQVDLWDTLQLNGKEYERIRGIA
jgi:plasmid maintenance system antidote protein VapI